MFALTMKRSQFQIDQNTIESEWDMISKELHGLQSQYQKIKTGNFHILALQIARNIIFR